MEQLPSEIVLDYKGIVTFNTISNLLPKLKENLDRLGEKVNTYKRLLTITIEILENCFRYIDNKMILKPHQDQYPSYFKIVKNGSEYKVEAGNTVLKEDMEIIISKLDTVNGMDETGLRNLYKRTIANGQFSEVGGAGLGFIELAKASSQKISFSFKKIEQEIYYYTINLDVKP